MATLSQVLRGSFRMLGLGMSLPLTGGSATTAVIGRFANEETPPEDDFCLNWTFFADEADGAAPEGEFANVTNYDGGTYTLTFDTLTAALASGDRGYLCRPTVSLSDMIAAVNTALAELEAVPLIDTSITFDSDTQSYSLPANMINVLSVEYIASGDTARQKLPSYSVVVPATVSGQATLYLAKPVDGTAYITYDGTHAAVGAYNDTISPTIPLQLAIAQTAHCALRNVSQQSPLWQEKYNAVIGELNAARQVKKQKRAFRRNPTLDVT